MNKLMKNKKKKGFTLVELIAVMAILAILAAVLAPKVLGYINKSKQTKIIQQSHVLVMAVDAYNVDHETTPIDETKIVSTYVGTGKALEEFVNDKDVSMIAGSTVADCRKVNQGNTFTLGTGGILGTVN